MSDEMRSGRRPARFLPARVGRLALVGLLTLAPLALAAPASRAAEAMTLLVDQAQIMRLSRPAATVIIGNPSIADATIRDNRTLIITGRGFGTTNLIALDSDGEAITDRMLTVEASDPNAVTMYKLAERQTFSCTPNCQPTITVGDNAEVFNDRRDQITSRNTLAAGGGN